MVNGRITGLIIENKAGRSAVYARSVIDSTGDADVAFRAGVPFESGNPQTGRNQPMSVRYIMSGIDIGRFTEFMHKLCEGKNIFHYQLKPPGLHGAVVWDRNWPLEPLFKEAYEAGDITFEDGAYWQYFGIPNRSDSLAFNCPEIFEGVDGTSPVDLTNAQIYAKKTILRHIRFYKKYLPGFENSYVSDLASQVGIRESRRIKGIYERAQANLATGGPRGTYCARGFGAVGAAPAATSEEYIRNQYRVWLQHMAEDPVRVAEEV
jgi:hypothetical protein